MTSEIQLRPAEEQPERADATPEPQRCAKCLNTFDPDDIRVNGNARSAKSPYCRYCVTLCTQSQSFLHLCMICR